MIDGVVMLLFGLLTIIVAIATLPTSMTPSLTTRTVSLVLLLAAVLTADSLVVSQLGSGVSIFGGLFQVTTTSQSIELFMLVTAALVLTPWYGYHPDRINDNNENFSLHLHQNANAGGSGSRTARPELSEYALVALFSIAGSSFLVSAADLVSLFLALELQSFGVYVLATLYRDVESATAAGLKYFFLGALSSALILLGAATIYSYAGVTSIEAITTLVTVPTGSLTDSYSIGLTFGLLLVLTGLLFKIAAAPFHSWAPDVYDGVPTVVTTWLTILPKISIVVVLLNLQSIGSALVLTGQSFSVTPWNQLLLMAALLSLIIGSLVGLAQPRLKRLLAYSTISHVGFMLLALASDSSEATEAVLFYLVQYSLTSVAVFFIVLAFGYYLNNSVGEWNSWDIEYWALLGGQGRYLPALGLSFALCLFSMAGVPPLLGFFGKQYVLLAALHSGYYFACLVGILTSVVSAAYYLRVVQQLFFDTVTYTVDSNEINLDEANPTVQLNPVHSFVIAVSTLLLVVFVLKPALVLNSMHLLALSVATV